MGQKWVINVEERRYGRIVVDQGDVEGAAKAVDWETFAALITGHARSMYAAGAVIWEPWERDLSTYPNTVERDEYERRRAGR